MGTTLVLDHPAARSRRLLAALQAAGIDARLSETPLDARRADRLVVPDGDDDDATLAQGMSTHVLDAIAGFVDTGRPLLCTGFALSFLLAGQTHEAMPQGIGLFQATPMRFDPRITDEGERPLMTPHTGYSLVVGLDRHPDIGRVVPKDEPGIWLYFRHRLCAPSRVPQAEVAISHHGVPFAGAIWRGAVLGVQFLPEHSGLPGLELLRAWDQATRTKGAR